ncbi:hypothetical protein EaACW_pEA290009 (plasmid) [Erwinia amylovora ACW56400]|uniref:Uncharacterized protein n=1 Tax=Erwinia amylovora NBRC 12687 = CFBP 1232 TaxID=1219359 RepID=A0A831A4Z4_ERWAM|nr:hypothetical protein EaACW_pEA290009 [Erwinia amylovora ACW56400]CCO80600.1 hypothetical protein BN432_pEA290009 [Erwinia amylovora Ea356]CCO84416.1 hypothetical protein BN433_pEA290009 [Erwinia amylovora Ea266]CCO91959.1 hypothetical protein BN435_pEA290009 [Erwinia amylovora 01SFR-BO]CCO95753.1 hypothetical protein BN437_pEA290009 [Erwinia amylovora NBRC 12687 = CFBP 1232]
MVSGVNSENVTSVGCAGAGHPCSGDLATARYAGSAVKNAERG